MKFQNPNPTQTQISEIVSTQTRPRPTLFFLVKPKPRKTGSGPAYDEPWIINIISRTWGLFILETDLIYLLYHFALTNQNK